MRQIKLAIPKPNAKQERFLKSAAKYTMYGGARGGGKSWAVRTKAMLLALEYPGCQILILRRTYPELYENHVIPMARLTKEVAVYKKSEKAFQFLTGSRIVMGYCDNEMDVLRYQGQAYDAIFLDEATHFTKFQFDAITECCRSSGLARKKMRTRMYLTCNPGGVGHAWVKRLFVDRQYEGAEREEDYAFIKATVRDNTYLQEHDPEYIRVLENLPEDRRRAMLDGDWDVFAGQYFSEFRREIHVCEPFEIPDSWAVYRATDYGLDMLHSLWAAFSPEGTAYIIREVYGADLIVSAAAEKMNRANAEHLEQDFAPPDLWNRQKDTGKSIRELFAESGIYFTRAQNNRVDGWLNLKEWLKPYKNAEGKETAALQIFEGCTSLISCMPQLQRDVKNPCDAAKDPHDITHGPDALRYLFAGRPSPSQKKPDARIRLPQALITDEDMEGSEVMKW